MVLALLLRTSATQLNLEVRRSSRGERMWPINMNMRKPDLTFDGFFGLGAMADSKYEYLTNMH